MVDRSTLLTGRPSQSSKAKIVGLCALVTVLQFALLANWTEQPVDGAPLEKSAPREAPSQTPANPAPESDGAAAPAQSPGTAAPQEGAHERIFASVRAENIKPLRNPRFATKLGARIPRTIRLYAVTTEMVRSLPAFAGHQFLLLEEQILIVEPRQKKIVAALDNNGPR